jgi:glycosyltransferase involved in cell wall biosynthesis
MPLKKILWLCSWYPSETDHFNGDFIQRHAQAASLYNDVHVVHVEEGAANKETQQKLDNLTEQIIYLKTSHSLFKRVINQYRVFKSYKNAVKKYINRNGKPDIVHVHIPLKAGLGALWIKRKYGIPFVCSEHWGIYNKIVEDNYLSRPFTFRRAVKKIIDSAALFLSVSKYLAGEINNMVSQKKYQVIPNTVNTDLFYYSVKYEDKFRFIHVSNMAPLKNAAGILRAFKILLSKTQDARLVIVGNTTDDLKQYAEQLGIQSFVDFKGEIPYSQVAREMRLANCLVLFSNIENSPCVIGESLCCGLPVIATNVGGIPELIDSFNGILIESGKENLLAEAMLEKMANYQRYDLQKIAGEAKNKFSYSVVGKLFDDVYNGMLQQH